MIAVLTLVKVVYAALGWEKKLLQLRIEMIHNLCAKTSIKLNRIISDKINMNHIDSIINPLRF